MTTIRVQREPFDPGREHAAFIACGNGQAGAAVTFTGIVRSNPNDPLLAMEIEHFPELAEAEIGRIVAEATARFRLLDAFVVHRFGAMRPGEAIMQVTTLALHRAAAFEAAEFLMDYLKSGAPFWKKETTAAGVRWVDAKSDDEAALARWGDE